MALEVKNPPVNVGDRRDVGLIPRSGRSPGGGHDSPLQCSCLQNPMDRGVWWATVHRVTESDTTEVTSHTHTHTYTELFYSVQFSPVAQSCLILCDPMDCSTPGLLVHDQLLEYFTTIIQKNYFVVYLKFRFSWVPCILSEEYF